MQKSLQKYLKQSFWGLKHSLWVMILCFASPAWAADVTLNFKNADIRAFIEFVSGFSGKNFLIDNRVKGNVTILSPTPISEKDAYDVFLAVLETNGFAAVEGDAVVKIIPRAESKQKSLPVKSANKRLRGDGMVTQVLPLNYADAQQLVALIRPLIAPNSHLVAYPRGNMLLLTDSGSNIERIKKILKLVDRRDAIGIQIFPLEYASADKLAPTLTSLYAQKGVASANLKAIAHNPGNILVVVAAPQLLNEITVMIKKLDMEPKADSGRLQVRYLKNANAEDVAKVLNELVGHQTTTGKQGKKTLFVGDVKFVAEPATNALLITADTADMAAIDGIINKLDIRRLQVLVEALIVEVRGSLGQQLGVEWLAGDTFSNDSYSVVGGQNYGGFNQLGAAAVAAGSDASSGDLAAGVVSGLASGLTIGLLQGSINGGPLSLGAILHALESSGNANVLSTPNILTMDNEEAEIIVGQNVPFVTGQSSTQGGVANPFQTIERKDIGLTLRVKPQISDGDTIRLEIYQEVSSISPTTVSGASDLITNKRSIKTVALAKDNTMLVLGGLMREDQSTTVNRVPCLGTIPLLGEFFTSTDTSMQKTNLMVFLRPRIIRTDADIMNITSEKYSNIKTLFETPSVNGTILFPRYAPELPEGMNPYQGLKSRQSTKPTQTVEQIPVVESKQDEKPEKAVELEQTVEPEQAAEATESVESKP